jgi:hypothetical protein
MADNPETVAKEAEASAKKRCPPRVRMVIHVCSRTAHKLEVPGHAIYFGLLGFGFHEAYVWAALVMFVIVVVASLPEGVTSVAEEVGDA